MNVRFIEKLITFLFDVVALNVAFFTAYWIRFRSGYFSAEISDMSGGLSETFSYLEPSLILCIAWVILFYFTGLYRDWIKESRVDEFFVVARTVFIGLFMMFLVTGAPQILEFAQTGDVRKFLTPTKFATLFTYGGCVLFFASADRFAVHTLIVALFSKGIVVRKVLIVGADESGEELVKDINSFPQLGYRVAGFIDDNGLRKGGVCAGLPVLGTYSDIPAVVGRERAAALIIGRVSGSASEISRILDHCGPVRLSASIYIERNLYITKFFPLRPTRSCLYIAGPWELALTNSATARRTGAPKTSTHNETATSTMRLTCASHAGIWSCSSTISGTPHNWFVLKWPVMTSISDGTIKMSIFKSPQ
jgi:hypothetical protein